MTGTHQAIIPNDHTVDQEYITFCGRLNCNALGVIVISADAASSNIFAFFLPLCELLI